MYGFDGARAAVGRLWCAIGIAIPIIVLVLGGVWASFCLAEFTGNAWTGLVTAAVWCLLMLTLAIAILGWIGWL